MILSQFHIKYVKIHPHPCSERASSRAYRDLVEYFTCSTIVKILKSKKNQCKTFTACFSQVSTLIGYAHAAQSCYLIHVVVLQQVNKPTISSLSPTLWMHMVSFTTRCC